MMRQLPSLVRKRIRDKGLVLLLACACACVLVPTATNGQVRIPRYPDSMFSTYYHQRATLFEALPHTPNSIVFLGNSITDGGEWSELFGDARVKNRGISGDVTTGVLQRLAQVIAIKPRKLFLLIGINDLARGTSPDTVLARIRLIVSLVHGRSPATRIYVQSLLPVNPAPGLFPHHVDKGTAIRYINARLKRDAPGDGYTYVDVYDALADDSGRLDLRYTNDGLHLLGPGYMVWKHVLYPYVYGLQEHPSLLPLPQSVQWTAACFPLYRCHSIVVADTALDREGADLTHMLAAQGLQASVTRTSPASGPFIALRLAAVESPLHEQEAYEITVDAGKVVVAAATPHGIFNGLQTLRQLARDGVIIPGCRITDWPAFSWRGYMVDVGRNFQSLGQLKQQIRVMARYKLNVFHIHLTENLAWRLQIERYPALTAPENMLRDKGQYYSIRDMKELIKYCRRRFITLVPEIDMPGHSAAFTRTFGVDMQSEQGLAMVKNILEEVDSTYRLPYMHIGADEVRFTNKDFIPAVEKLLHGEGKTVIGWNPGGNYDEATIRQLWSAGKMADSQARYIDSRSLYLNHMDPLAGVVSIFERQLCDAACGNSHLLGGEICLWNDRRVGGEQDLLRMNPVYPCMLAFAERSWRGGGLPGTVTAIGEPGSARYRAFSAFEKRLCDQKREYFRGMPFPYVRQSDRTWKLFGPFSNNGNLSASFWPEKKGTSPGDSAAARIAVGGTVILRHWWFPALSGWLGHPRQNTTWYGWTRFYSQTDTTGYLWIGFNDLSRSMATDDPKAGTWNDLHSRIWLNGHEVPPPRWEHGGAHGNAETPLTDEGYSYRPPTRVRLTKGWNDILVKAPVGSFKGSDWQNPVKWMFTALPVRGGYGCNMLPWNDRAKISFTQ